MYLPRAIFISRPGPAIVGPFLFRPARLRVCPFAMTYAGPGGLDHPHTRFPVKHFVTAALLLFAVPAFAANTATITFSAPTTYTDGSSIGTASISYNVYQGAKGSTTKPKVATITATSTTVSTGLQAGQEYCWEVTAVVNGIESAHSNEGCKSFPFPTPSAVTITVQ